MFVGLGNALDPPNVHSVAGKSKVSYLSLQLKSLLAEKNPLVYSGA